MSSSSQDREPGIAPAREALYRALTGACYSDEAASKLIDECEMEVLDDEDAKRGLTSRFNRGAQSCAARPSEDGPLWSLLDWSLWGAGMADTFREPLADIMLAAVPAETVAQAEAAMAEFIERRRIEKTGVTVWQEQRDELKQLRAQVAELKSRLCTCKPVRENDDVTIPVVYHHVADCLLNGGAR
ncbi:hypothetical protein OG285_32685 [Streptomyces sp. NBC_01471]|uniref:hypothetical protein n=1 Tax=Streptomyces sp. NBC_01471 TaxID=2903879 RepID=UPI0032484AB1